MKRATIVKVCVVSAIAVAGAVCAGLVIYKKMTRADLQDEYAKIHTAIEKIADGKSAVEKFLDLDLKEAKLDEAEKRIVDEFEKVASEESIKTLRELGEFDDENVKKLVDGAADICDGIGSLYTIEQDMKVMLDGELSDNDLEALSESKSDYLAGLARDMRDYRAKVKALDPKSGDFDNKYKALLEEGEKLQKRYSDIKLEDLLGKKKEDVLSCYDKIDELNKYLLEQEQK